MNFQNFHFFHSASSSSSDEFDSQVIDQFESINETENLLGSLATNNTILATSYLEQHESEVKHGGSIPGRIVIPRDREMADRNLFNDYFAENPRYNEVMFRRHFRMSRGLFLRIVDAVKNHDRFFTQRIDGLGRLGLSTNQKITAAMRMLAYGTPADAADEYIKIGESTTIQCLQRFCRDIVEVFAERYLRSPTHIDIERLLRIGEKRGFLGMLGSLDCMHWRWKNCPTAWAGQYAGRSGSPTIILEAVADYDLWIWHAFFGMPGSNNDINVLEASNLFSNLAQGIAPPANYLIGGKEYHQGYYLADGMYPKWSTLVQTIHDPRGPKKKYFAMKQESCRKDVERAFGVLQSRFAIVASPARAWQKKDLQAIMTACIIMHNMIIEDERDLNTPIQDAMEAPTANVEIVTDQNIRFQEFFARYKKVRDRDAHFALRDALIDHLWDLYSNSIN